MISILGQCYKATTKASEPNPQTPATTVPDLSSPALVARLHARITQTIKRDADQSVYTRILRYEPVVLEDLVEWFAERDIELGEVVVKGWCDKEGVCCVGRQSLSGGKRARH